VLPRHEQARRRAGLPQAGNVDTGGQGQPRTRSTQLGRAVDTEGASYQPMLRAVSLRLNSIYDTEQGPTDTLGPHRQSGSPLDPVDAAGSRRGAPRAPISSRTRSVAPDFGVAFLAGRWPTEAARSTTGEPAVRSSGTSCRLALPRPAAVRKCGGSSQTSLHAIPVSATP
jgi:hypothetical protein